MKPGIHPDYHNRHGALRLRPNSRLARTIKGDKPERRNLLELPSFLHRQAEAD